MRVALAILAVAIVACVSPAHAADAAFTQFIASLWPEAQAAGVIVHSPKFHTPTCAPSQAEFVQVPADYIREASIARLAAQGQKLMQQYRPSLDAIEARFGVPATVVLAIWGRETDFGRYTLPFDLIRVLATQA